MQTPSSEQGLASAGEQGRPRRPSRRLSGAWIVFGIGAALSLLAFLGGRSWDRALRAQTFREEASIHASAIDRQLQELVTLVRSVAQFYTACDVITQDEFSSFTRPSLDREPLIRALEWLPRVVDDERAAFEHRVRREGISQFAIRDLVQGQLIPAAKRPDYFPILRIEPARGNLGALGFDPSGDPVRRGGVEEARRSRQPTASPPLTLVQEPNYRRGLAILVPAFKADHHAEQGSNPAVLIGFASGVIRMGAVVDTIAARFPLRRFDLMLRDQDTPGEAGIFHPFDLDTTQAAIRRAHSSGLPIHETTLTLAGRHLEFTAIPRESEFRPSVWPHALAAIGLALSVAAAMWMNARVRTRREIAEREERLRLFIRYAPAALAVFDRNMRYIAASRRWLTDYGLGDEDLIGRSYDEVFPEIPETWREAHRRGLTGEVLSADEERFDRRDGSTQWLRWEIRPWLDANGEVAGIGIFAEDISARKAAEAALEESEERFRLFMDNSPTIASIKNEQGRYLYFNQTYEQQFGVRGADWLGKTDSERWPTELAEQIRGSDRAALDADRVLEVTEEYPASDGTGTRIWQVFRIPFKDSFGHRYLGSISVEVTASRRAEQALRQQLALQDQLGRISLSVPGLVFSFRLRRDGSMCLPFATPALADICGVTPLEAAKDFTPVLERVHPDDLDALLASIHEAATTLTTWHEEFRIIHPEKGERWVEGHCLPGREADGGVLGHGFLQDVTARKQGEIELKRFKQIVETSSEKLQFIDNQGRLQVVNPAYAKLYGCSPEDLRGLPMDELLGPGTYARIAPHLRAALAGEPQFFELSHRYPTGLLRHMEVEQRPFVVNGVVQGVVVSLHDVTEAHEAKAALEAQQARLEELVAERTADLRATEAQAQLILNSSANGIYGIDLTGRVIFINPSACAMLGYTADALMGREIHRLIHHTHRDGTPYPASACPTVAAGRRQEVVRVEDEVYWRSDGTALPVYYAAHPMQRDGDTVGVVVTFVDASAQKAASAAREAALHEAERLAQARSDFLANMSHEIRTPLNGVLGLAKLGQRHSGGRKVQQTFEQILTAGQHLLGVVDDVLDYSKIEAGKLGLEQGRVDLGRIIDRSLMLVAERAYAKGLDLKVEEDPSLPESCDGDSLRLSQVLVNLLGNAIKFTERGRVTLAVERDADNLLLRIQDTGVGMSKDQLTRLFRPFHQADGSTSRRFGGTGLGLTISRHLVELMGGQISVESEPEGGSTFAVRLPLANASAPIATPEGSVGLLGWPIDDTDLLVNQLAARGIRAAPVMNETEAEAVDLVLADSGWFAGRHPDNFSKPSFRIAVFAHPDQTELPAPWRGRAQRLDAPLRVRHLVALLRDSAWTDQPLVIHGPRLGGLKIVAAEDNALNRVVLTQLLATEGAPCACFEDGLALLDHLEQVGDGAYHILLTDIQMPGLDGYETARRCRERFPNLPVVGLTAHAMPEERERCLAAGMVEHLAKPIDLDRLVEVVRRYAQPPALGSDDASGQFNTSPESSVSREESGGRANAASDMETDGGPEPLIDVKALKAHYRDKPAFPERLFGILRATYGDGPRKLRAAAAAGDFETVAFEAHSIKGMSGNLMAWGLYQLAKKTDRAARSADTEARALAEALASGLEEVLAIDLSADDEKPSEPAMVGSLGPGQFTGNAVR